MAETCIFCGKDVRYPATHEPACPHKPEWWDSYRATRRRHPSSGRGVVTEEEWGAFEEWLEHQRADRGQ